MTYTPKPHVTQNWVLAKPGAQGTRGMVASQAREAAEAGVAMLDEGGNAVDAAVACAFALTAVEPWNSGLGGIGLAVVHPDGASRAHVVDFGPRAPAALEPSKFRLTGRMRHDLFAWPEVEHDANIHGALSFVIPSAVEGYRTMHERWGKLPLHIVMEPALMLARRGLAQDWYTTLTHLIRRMSGIRWRVWLKSLSLSKNIGGDANLARTGLCHTRHDRKYPVSVFSTIRAAQESHCCI